MLPADRQSGLIKAIFHSTHFSGASSKGLEVYRRSLMANAHRALEVSFPTIRKLLGEDSFRMASLGYLMHVPPVTGDWGNWGGTFPQWLAGRQEVETFGYVADCARLDWLCHLAERASDSEMEWESLLELLERNSHTCHIILKPGTTVLASPFPVVDIWQAHQGEAAIPERTLRDIRDDISAGKPQVALVWREKWKAKVRELTPIDAQWFGLILSGHSVGVALDQMADTTFNFSTWLVEAVGNRTISHAEHPRHPFNRSQI